MVAKETRKIKIGILNESKLLPCSEAVRRAMRIAEKALSDIGYQLVQFNIDDEFWTRGKDFVMGMISNGTAPPMLDEFKNECETMLKPIENSLMMQ